MSLPSMRLDGRVALVTGASQGIGYGISLALAEAGADVVVTDLGTKASQMEAAASALRALGRHSQVVPLDVTDSASVQRAAQHVLSDYGRVDILVNNAGVNIRRLAVNVTESEWDQVHNVDLKGLFFCCQTFGKHMIEARFGRIVNGASIMGVIGYRYRVAYCAAKAGVVNLTRVLALEWAEFGVNVNAIAPTFVVTPLTSALFEDTAFREDVLRRTPVGRLGTVEDVVGAVVFLASPAANFITGQTLLIDGGWTCM